MSDRMPMITTDLDPERTLLGSLLRETKIPEELRTRLAVHDFSPQHRLLASAVLSAFENHSTCDILTVGAELTRLGGGITEANLLLLLAERAPIGGDLAHLYRLVCEKNGQRSIVDETEGVQVFIATEPPPLVMDVEGVRLSGDNGFTAGLPKAMKGLLSLEEARANATGTPFLGHFPTRKARVLYVSEEDRVPRLHRRVHAMMQGRPPEEIPADDQLRFLIKRGVRLDTEKGIEVLRRHIGIHRPDLIFLEHFDKMHTKNRDREEECKPLLMELDKLTDEYGCTFRVQKHAKKTPVGQKPRSGELMAGSVALFGWGDSSIHLTLIRRGYSIVECEAKDGELTGRFFVEYQDGRLVYAGSAAQDKKEKRQAEILDVIGLTPGVTTEEIGERINLSTRQVWVYLKALQASEVVVGSQETSKQPMRWHLKGTEPKEKML